MGLLFKEDEDDCPQQAASLHGWVHKMKRTQHKARGRARAETAAAAAAERSLSPSTRSQTPLAPAAARARAQFLPAWNRRWLTVEGAGLHWYSGKRATKPSGSLQLADVTSVAVFERGEEGVYSFVVRARARNLLLRVDSMRRCKYWVRARARAATAFAVPRAWS